jgi:hypothetical protein
MRKFPFSKIPLDEHDLTLAVAAFVSAVAISLAFI